MFRAAAIAFLAVTLASCDLVDNMTEGFKHANDVASDLESSTGMRPGVGFKWTNGKLVSVSVQFPKLYETKPLRELVEMVQASSSKHFKQAPGTIVLSFEVTPAAGKTAQAQ